MTAIALPAGFVPSTFSLRLSTVQRAYSSPFSGSEQVIDLLNDRWMASMQLAPRTQADAARVEAFVAAMRGMTNTAALYHFARKVPRGTMRGTPTVSTLAAPLAPAMLLATTPGATLRAGDMIGVVGLLLQVAQDTAADGGGIMLVNLVNRLRKVVPGGSVVTWDRPTTPFRLVGTPSQQYVPGYAEGVALDFVEAIP